MIPRLFAITPGDDRPPSPWVEVVAEAGIRGLLVRSQRDPSAWVRAARDAGFTCIFAHIRDPGALEAGADGLHLPDDGHAPPPGFAWSRSTHSPEAARSALDAGASFVSLSPIWSPTSKPQDRRPTLGIEGVLAAGPGPVLALGGVSPARLASLRSAGGYGALVLGPLSAANADDLRGAALALSAVAGGAS